MLQITPQLYRYTTELLFGEVWKRHELAARDRSLITLAALISAAQTAQMVGHLKLGLDNGLKPSEISAMITHLAFYAGWPNAMSAVPVTKTIFAERGITLEPNASAISAVVGAVGQQPSLADVTPQLAHYTDTVVFGGLWRQTDLGLRDRSLITIAALIAQGQSAQLLPYLNLAMDNGLSQSEAAEVVTHLAFYVGWPKAMSAVPIFKQVFASRG
ncbi:carboxymuconolactone decarboxylase family protein [Pseudomonas sp. 6D_7.1_Bac1]|nr:carboxymuconolactone decarboxylase family protein [Pseudomonas sp. 6D_7.1_Bac1]MCU1752742.1 carboxymuconolactone decarboxylase family protein [Pseudomonas sp. 6D_7.1_Bac1]